MQWIPDTERLWHRVNEVDERDEEWTYCGLLVEAVGVHDKHGNLEQQPYARGLRCQQCVRLAPEA